MIAEMQTGQTPETKFAPKDLTIQEMQEAVERRRIWEASKPPTWYLSGIMIPGLIDMVKQCGVFFAFGRMLAYCRDDLLTAADLQPVLEAMIASAEEIVQQGQTLPRTWEAEETEEVRTLPQTWTKADAVDYLTSGIAQYGVAWVMCHALDFFRRGVLTDMDLEPVYFAVRERSWLDDLNRMIAEETRRRNCQVVPAPVEE